MWIAKFIFCTMLEGCTAVTFDDQTSFATQEECELYTESKSDLVVETMSKHGVAGKIYYDCEYKETGVKI